MLWRRLALIGLIPVVALVLTRASAAQGAAAAQDPDSVIEKFLAASGGRDAISKLTSRRSTGTVAVSTPAGDIQGTIQIEGKAPNKTRVVIVLDLSAMGAGSMTIEQKFDGVAGIVMNSLQGNSEVTGMMLDSMKNNAFPTPLLNYKGSATLSSIPSETVNGKPTVGVAITPKTGPAVKMYFDPETSLIVRSTTMISSPEVGVIEQSSTVSDYRDVGGVKLPFKVVNANAAQTVTITLTKVEHNVPLDDALFAVK